MRRIFNVGIAVMAMAAAGAQAAKAEEGAGGAAVEPVRAVATVPAAHSILSAVLGDAGTAHLLIPGAASPHTYSMKPSDARALEAADLVVWVGPDLETFLDGRLETLSPDARIVTWQELPGLILRDVRDGGEWDEHDHGHGEGHDHGHDHGHAHDHGHDHGHDDGHDHGDDHGGAIDAHLWLDPRNAKLLAAALADELATLAPARAETFAASAAAFAAGVDALDADLAARLEPAAGKRFLVFHDAYQYFEQRYGLSGAGSVTVSPEVAPGAARVREIRDRIVDGDIDCVFAEPQFRPDLIATLVEGTGARPAVLDPVGADLTPGPGLYPALLEGLGTSLAACLVPGGE